MEAEEYLLRVISKYHFTSLGTLNKDQIMLIAGIIEDYANSKVKELKENDVSRDKNIVTDTHDADSTKPMIGSCAFPDPKDIFISESPSQTPIGSMESDQNVKVCVDCGKPLNSSDPERCFHCSYFGQFH